MRTRCCLLVLLVGVSLTSGCTKKVKVTGRVLDQGKPVPNAQLRWVHEDDSVASGVSDANGNYILESSGKPEIAIGHYNITVIWYQTPEGKPLAGGEEGGAGKAKAVQVNATMILEVTPTSTQLDIDVTHRKKIVPE